MPGKPDIILKDIKTVIFVQGCFWHRHEDCTRASKPKSNQEYWSKKKFSRNVECFQEVKVKQEKRGWRVLVYWECDTKDESKLEEFILDNF